MEIVDLVLSILCFRYHSWFQITSLGNNYSIVMDLITYKPSFCSFVGTISSNCHNNSTFSKDYNIYICPPLGCTDGHLYGACVKYPVIWVCVKESFYSILVLIFLGLFLQCYSRGWIIHMKYVDKISLS